MLAIYPILCRAGFMDNYSYLLIDKASGISAVVDPSETAPIVAACNRYNTTPSYILNTHHHFDHTDSNLEIKKLFQNLKIVGNLQDAHRIPGIDITISPGDTFMLGESPATIINAPGHTHGHILWYFQEDKALFTGDVLFNLCIGGLFEGTAKEMFSTLQIIKQLPDDLRFYPGHEYTHGGAAMAQAYSTNIQTLNNYLQKAQKNQKILPAEPFTLGEEKQCNPYLLATSLNEFEQLL